MTLSTPDDKDSAADEIFALVKGHLREFVLEIEQHRTNLKNDRDADSPGMKKLLTDFRTTSDLCLKEANRVEDLHRKQAGIVHEFAFDLEAARNEIRGRLASLRNAASADRLSE